MIEELLRTAFANRSQLPGFEEDMNRLAHCHTIRRDISRKFFDSVDEEAWKDLSKGLPRTDEYIPFIEKNIGSRELILEIGTGGGDMLPLLLNYSARVLAVDNSREMLNRTLKFLTARQISNRVELRLGDAEHLPVADSAAGLSVCPHCGGAVFAADH